MQTTMRYDSKYGNKGLEPLPTGSYEVYLKTGDDVKSVKEEETTTGSRIIVSSTAKNPRKKTLVGYFKQVNGHNATTITDLHTAALTLTSRPYPCINNIFLPSMILEVTSFSMTSMFPEFVVGSKWMVENFKIDRTPDKGFHTYELTVVLDQYFENLE
jgi:hypothetical protein